MPSDPPAQSSSVLSAEQSGDVVKNQNLFVQVVHWLSTLAGWVAASMILAAVAITCQMIYVRSVKNVSTVWQTEAVVYLAVGATLLGLSYVQLLRGHVNVDLLPLHLPQALRRWLHIIVLVASLTVVAIMFWYGFDYWHVAWERGWKSDTIWGVRLWIPYMALPVGFGLFFLQLLADLVSVTTGAQSPFGINDN